MSPLRYTEKQILCGIEEFLTSDTPSWLSRYPALDADARIDDYLQTPIPRWAREEIELDDVFSWFQMMEYFFHFQCSEKEWTEYFGLDLFEDDREEWECLHAADFTFRRLAQFIAARATVISFQPVEVLGTECGPAGTFYGIQQLVRTLKKRSPDFGPSTKIRDVLKGYSLINFWSHLRWMTGQRVAKLPVYWLWMDVMTFIVLCFLWGALMPVMSSYNIGETYIVGLFFMIFLGTIAAFIARHIKNPLPPELQTFRDLAVLIANHDCDAVREYESKK
ncbi:hypothetical protein [uncultured Gimesia sp.]|uniref:hypothetical protein n=1 Tax=uncultured Gimesia sp. TaxID=1678688 RepID=UPI0030D8BA3D|tara:strand:- start:31042 stop:31875 length:834 start_codon:yes stop_codon:yes gene_type:complete